MSTSRRSPSLNRRRNPLRGNCRPWWLLLALALFFAGQTLAAAHRHDDGIGGKSSDGDCALCIYSSTATAAVSTAGLQAAVIFAAVIGFTQAAGIRRAAVRFCDSRAPPVFQR